LSPDEKYVVTGSGATVKGGRGKLHFFKRDTLELVQELEMATSVVKVYWHSKINQIVVGLANGQMTVLYSPLTSINGAKQVVARGPRRKPTIEDAMQSLLAVPVLTPDAQSALADGHEGVLTGKRKREKGKVDPRKLRRPELPIAGPGRGGRVGASATQHVVQNLVRDTTRDEDVSFLPLTCVVLSLTVLAAERSVAQVRQAGRDGSQVDRRYVALAFSVERFADIIS